MLAEFQVDQQYVSITKDQYFFDDSIIYKQHSICSKVRKYYDIYTSTGTN